MTASSRGRGRSRRDFLKGVGAAGAGLVAGSVG
ncbi:MAG: twin-arginine translocation signal domain-containing protein, partial [Solirubrobacterales bacterium]|nr:twin-arginine translocation signal domain-containing protein [Solirubrobacterales bacterium]